MFFFKSKQTHFEDHHFRTFTKRNAITIFKYFEIKEKYVDVLHFRYILMSEYIVYIKVVR